MKKYLLLNALCLLLLSSQAQPVLNEVYITPGSSLCNGTARQEFFEIYNGNQGNGNAVSNIGCYYLVTRWETGGGGVGNEGFYVVDFPSNAATNTAGFYTASATSVYGTQTGNGNPCQFTASLNWNSGVTKRYTLAAGNTYTSATVTNVFNLFDESLSQLTVLLYNGTSVVDAFVGGGGGNINNILSRIHAWAPLNLTIDCVGSAQANTINFSNITATDIDAVNQAAGTDNGFIRKYDGNCAPWDKSSSPPFHTPGSPNNGGLIPNTEPFWTSNFADPTCPQVPGQNPTTNDTIRDIRNVTSVTYYVYRDINLNGTYDLGIDPLFGTAHTITFPANATSYIIQGIELPVDQTSFVLVRMSNGSNCFYTQNIFTTACGPLPVVFSSFAATRKGNTAVLNWRTQTELNAKSFEVEILSGNTYVKVGSVAATNNASGSSYNFIDNNTAKSTSLYRLKIIDRDNSFKYSEVRSVKGLSAVSDFILYPNPSTGSAKVMITDVADGMQVQLMDNTGRTIKTITLKNSNTVELNGLQKGVYLVKVTNTVNNESVVKKLTVN
jgi:Secretion system C-terminal sorting domain